MRRHQAVHRNWYRRDFARCKRCRGANLEKAAGAKGRQRGFAFYQNPTSLDADTPRSNTGRDDSTWSGTSQSRRSCRCQKADLPKPKFRRKFRRRHPRDQILAVTTRMLAAISLSPPAYRPSIWKDPVRSMCQRDKEAVCSLCSLFCRL